MDTRKYLKVFIDGYSLNKEHQGVNTYIKEIYKELARQTPDYRFYIGCFVNESITKEFNNFPNISFINYKNKSRIYRMLFEIPDLIKKNRFDFAHFQYVLPFIRDKKCKYVLTIHDILFNDFKSFFPVEYRLKRNYLFRISAKKSNFLLTVSEYSRNKIANKYRLNKKHIVITPNGVNRSFFKPYDKIKSRSVIKDTYGFDQYILYVSRIEPRKNQELLLGMYLNSGLDKTNTHLVFIGSKTLENKQLEEMINHLSIGQRGKIHFYENIQQNDLINFYKGAKLFVYPSLAEGFGIPPLEAGAFKIPVLCSNTTAMSSYTFFKPYLCDPADGESFQKSFDHFIKNYSSIDIEMIQKRIKENYTWHQSAKELALIYKNDYS